MYGKERAERGNGFFWLQIHGQHNAHPVRHRGRDAFLHFVFCCVHDGFFHVVSELAVCEEAGTPTTARYDTILPTVIIYLSVTHTPLLYDAKLGCRCVTERCHSEGGARLC